MSDDIISFTEYLKKRNKRFQVDPGFIEALGDDIKNRPELLEWFRFQTTFHRHKLFLHSLFTANRAEARNPNAGYFMCFTEEQIAHNTSKVLEALQWLDRTFIHIDAKDCTFGDMARQLSSVKPGRKRDAWNMFKEVLLGSDKVIVLSNLSQSKISSQKSSQARSLIKINDDAHFDVTSPGLIWCSLITRLFYNVPGQSLGHILKWPHSLERSIRNVLAHIQSGPSSR